MLKIFIGTNEGKVLCISNNEDKIKASMVNYLIDTDQEPTEDFFESRNWGEYDIEVYEYHQPQLNKNQQIVVNDVKQDHENYGIPKFNAIHLAFTTYATGYYKDHLKNDEEFYQVLSTLIAWASEQEEE